MSASDNFSGADWVKRRLAELRQQLGQSGDLPEPARQLWERLRGEPPPSEVDDASMREIAQAALNGMDIEASYPVFFDMLVADKRLQAEFLRVMAALEEQNQADSAPAASRPPRHIEATANGWRVIWELTAAQIQAAFEWQKPGRAYRDMPAYAPTPSHFLLLQSRTDVMGDEVAVALNAAYQAESPDALQLSVSVGAQTTRPMSMQAQVRWGAYDQTVVITGTGDHPLPAAALADLLDETGEQFRHDLRLTLAARPREATL